MGGRYTHTVPLALFAHISNTPPLFNILIQYPSVIHSAVELKIQISEFVDSPELNLRAFIKASKFLSIMITIFLLQIVDSMSGSAHVPFNLTDTVLSSRALY